MHKKWFKKFIVLVLLCTSLFSAFNVGKVLAAEPSFKLTNVSIKEKSAGVDATISTFDNDSVNLNAIFYHLDDYIVYDLSIKNTTDKTYTIKSVTDNNTNEFVTYIYDTYQGVALKPNDSVIISLKSVYKNALDDINYRDQQNDVKLSILLVDENGEEVETDININPKTGDSIMFYTILGSASLLGLVIILIKKQKNAKKVIVALIVFIPFIAKAYTASVVITLSNHIKLSDKILVTKNILGTKTEEIVDYGSKIEKPADPVIDGYVFEGWYNGDEEFDFDKSYSDDVNLTAKFTLVTYNITYDYSGAADAANPPTYNVETDSITLINPTLEGFNFAGWTGSNGTGLQTSVTIQKGSTGDKEYVAHFSERDDITYTVKHRYIDIDGVTYTEYIQELTGVTGTIVYPEFVPKTGFSNPSSLLSLEIKPDGLSSITYEYNAIPCNLSYSDTTGIDLTESSPAGVYQYGDEITLKVANVANHTFKSWSDGSTDQTHTFTITEDTTISANFELNKYTVTFDSQGGSNVQNKVIEHGSKVGELETPTNPPKSFIGWYTNTNYDEEVTKDTIITGDVTFYARWSNFVCQKATNLHVNECENTVSGCHDTGYFTNGSKKTTSITFGKLNLSNNLIVGEALDCDVNNDNVFDSETERFYYLRTDENSNAVLIYYNNYANDLPNNSDSFMYNEDSVNNLGPVTAYEQLPKDTIWTNTKLYSTPRQLKTNNGETSTSDGDLVSFAYTGKAARLASSDDINEACSITLGNVTKGELDSCEFLLENTRYEVEGYRYGFWLETPKNDNHIFRVSGADRYIANVGATSITSVRPVIEVPFDLIDLTAKDGHIITLDPNGGSVSKTTFIVDNNESLGVLPNALLDNSIFIGWYTSKTGGEEVTSSTVPNSNETYYARYIPSIEAATIPTDIAVSISLNKQIDITGPQGMETYTYRSLDNSIVTVNSTGLLTGVTEGTTKVIIKGDLSGVEREINVTVNNNNVVTISFDSNGGEEVNPIQRAIGDVLGNLPETSKVGKAFEGWFTSKTGGDKVDSNTVVTANVTYYAHFKDYVCRKATTLHTEVCDRTSGGCYLAGYTANNKGTTITYGSITSGDALTSGDAFDCDVNGDGIYDPQNERFYYVTTDSNNIASLIYFNNYDHGNITCNEVSTYNDNDKYNEGPVTAQEVLPTTTEWKNVKLYNNPRTIVNEEGGNKTGSATLGTFTYDGTAARLLTTQEIDAACSITSGSSVNGELSDCTFLLENTRFKNQDACRYGYWLETPKKSTQKIFRVSGEFVSVGVGNATSVTGSRPVIEVPLNEIRLDDVTTHIVSFNANGGTVNPSSIEVEHGAVLDTMPTINKDNNIFEGWYNGNTLFDETAPITTDLNLTAKWTANVNNLVISPNPVNVTKNSTVSLIIDAPDNIETYDIVSSNNQIASLSGNTITGNEIGSTTLTITGLTSGEVVVVNVNVTADLFKVTYDPNGGSVSPEYVNVPDGNTISSLPTPTRDGYYFEGWYNGSELFDISTPISGNLTLTAKWSARISGATITPSSIQIRKGDSVNISISGPDDMEDYSIISAESSIASLNNLTVTGEEVGNTSIIITGSKSGDVVIINVEVLNELHTVTFINGSDISTTDVEDGKSITNIPSPSKTDLVFMGWFKGENGVGDELLSTTVISSDETYYAYFKAFVCKKATVLNSKKCDRTDSKGCIAEGYTNDDYVEFGTLVDGDLKPGDALDCDVNGNSKYNSDSDIGTERFYYLRTDENGNAVLIYSSNVSEGVINNSVNYRYDPTGNYNNVVPTTLISHLPDATLWTNVSLENPVYQVLNQKGGTTTSRGDLPQIDYTGKAARLLTLQDVYATGCISQTSQGVEGETARCLYLLDDSNYLSNSNKAYWIATPVENSQANVTRLAGSDRKFGTTSANNSTGTAVRPVIEVPIKLIDIDSPKQIVITFDPNFGSVSQNVYVIDKGSSLSELPNATASTYVLMGWYDENKNEEVTTSTVFNESTTVSARWLKTIEHATIEPLSLTINISGTEQINVSDEVDMENYSFESLDTSIVTVSSTGLVTGVSEGNTRVNIIGEKSHVIKYVDVLVNDSNVNVVTFDPTNSVMRTYYEYLNTWKSDSSTFESLMQENFHNHNCSCTDNTCSSSGTVYCDKPDGYDTDVNGAVNVYLYDDVNSILGEQVDYANASSGIIHNLIPNTVYYWESANDSSINGYVMFTGDRRLIDAGGLRNVRDLGGLETTSIIDGQVVNGTTKYGKLIRGEKISSEANRNQVIALGATKELDLRKGDSFDANEAKLSVYELVQFRHYQLDPESYPNYYALDREIIKNIMIDIADNDYDIYFHCRIGADRTGSVAYILEGLLGVSEEDRLQDYELTFFFGLVNRHRYYSYDASSSVSKTEKFVYMYNHIKTNEDIYNWFINGASSEEERQEDIALINRFRKKMINY